MEQKLLQVILNYRNTFFLFLSTFIYPWHAETKKDIWSSISEQLEQTHMFKPKYMHACTHIQHTHTHAHSQPHFVKYDPVQYITEQLAADIHNCGTNSCTLLTCGERIRI